MAPAAFAELQCALHGHCVDAKHVDTRNEDKESIVARVGGFLWQAPRDYNGFANAAAERVSQDRVLEFDL